MGTGGGLLGEVAPKLGIDSPGFSEHHDFRTTSKGLFGTDQVGRETGPPRRDLSTARFEVVVDLTFHRVLL